MKSADKRNMVLTNEGITETMLFDPSVITPQVREEGGPDPDSQ